jgi:tetratricopeptide (TPR) repeat protein
LIAFNQALAGEDDNPARLDAVVERGQVYLQQRRYDLAQDDFTEALDLSDGDLNIRALRMQAAYEAGDFAIAGDDADELLGEGVVSDGVIQLLQARILVDEASDSEDYQDALGLLDAIEGIPDDLRAIASEYQAQAHFSLGNNGDALNAIDRALAAGDTGSRHYLRGQILEAQNEPEAALREYEWVLTWGTVYPYSFLPDAEARVEALREE